MGDNIIGVIGASGLVGSCLLQQLTQSGLHVVAFSRQARESEDTNIEWRQFDPLSNTADISEAGTLAHEKRKIGHWICIAPIWVLPDYFGLLNAHGAQRIAVLSSTSRFTKNDSTDPEEQAVALRLAESEARVQTWAESHGVAWAILRPTLIYGLGHDKNITEIARFIRRFGFFPLFGKAKGLRQPVHAEDVASACLSAIQVSRILNRAYNISGGETLAYRDMVARVFMALGRRTRLVTVPLWAFRLAVTLLRHLPRYQKWSTAMAERMGHDLVFDNKDAAGDLGFSPRPFKLEKHDLPLP